MKCINCNSYFNFDELSKRRIREETAPKPVTHYDLLIHKTPEEMAEWLYNVPAAWYAKKEEWLDWLKQEAEEDE